MRVATLSDRNPEPRKRAVFVAAKDDLIRVKRASMPVILGYSKEWGGA
jgi:hypothetical protein